MNKYLIATNIATLILLTTVSVIGYKWVQSTNEHNKVLTEQIKGLNESVNILTKRQTYSISLSPTVDTKINTTFGKSQNITIQYFFKMDGNRMKIQPDSSFVVTRNSLE